MASTTGSLAPLAALLRDHENVISPYVEDSDEPPALGALAGAGPRASDAPDEYGATAARHLASALWLAVTVAVAAGATPEYEQAKEAVRSGRSDAATQLVA